MKAQRVNNRYYLIADNTSGGQCMLSDINLNLPISQHIITIFIAYQLKSLQGTYWTVSSFTSYDNAGYDAFVSFSSSGNLIILGTSSPTNNFIVIGSGLTNGVQASA